MDKSALDKMTDRAFDAIMGRLFEHGSLLGRGEKLVLRAPVREGGAHLEMTLSELVERHCRLLTSTVLGNPHSNHHLACYGDDPCAACLEGHRWVVHGSRSISGGGG